MADLSGQTFGKYQLIERLGRGGMAEVYKAYQPSLDRFVAVKMILDSMIDDEEFVKRFQREARLVAQLRHPHILQVIDYEIDNDKPFMVMEYIQGKNLKQHLQANGPMSQNDALRVAQQMADALAYAHETGMIHRDIKPANIMFTDAAAQHAVLTDFGIARMINGTMLTTTGMMLGTPAYLSPEAAQGDEVDGRTDIYGMGVVFYEMLTGRVPFNADTPLAIVMKQINEALPPVSQFGITLNPAVEAVLLRALMKDPEDRYLDAKSFSSALRKAQTALHDAPEQAAQAPQPIVATPPAEKPKRQSAQMDVPVENGTSTITLAQSAGATRAMWGVAAAVILLAVVIAGAALVSLVDLEPDDNDDDDTVALVQADSADPDQATLPNLVLPNTQPLPPRPNVQRPGLRPSAGPANDIFLQAEAALEDGNAAEAIRLLDEAIAIDSVPLFLETRSIAHQRLGNWNAALADINRAIERSPARAKFYEIRGVVHAELGDLDAAIADFELANDLGSDDVETLIELGYLYLDVDDLPAARSTFDTAIARDSSVAESHYGLATIFLLDESWEDALDPLGAAVELDPANLEYVLAEATTLVELGRLDDAFATVEELETDEDIAEVLLILGETYEASDPEIALEFYNIYLEILPEDLWDTSVFEIIESLES